MLKIVVIDDEPAICASLKFALAPDFEVTTFTEPRSALQYIATHEIAVILLDIMLGDINGLTLLDEITAGGCKASVIVMTAYDSDRYATEALRKGAFYYITKPMNIVDVQALVKRGAEAAALQDKVARLDLELTGRYNVQGIIGKSKAMQEVLNLIDKVKDIDSSVLICGESGTGKELIARAIHYSGKRKDGPFEVVNCAAIPYNLLESELFGYEKGAFTGASRAHKGKFELAHEGTIFLDEIGEMDLALQAKLLRIIQEKEVTPLGSEQGRKIDARVIAATNRNLEEAIVNNTFREDLFYRLNVISVKVPPLRDRKSDIPYLVNHFIRKHSSLQGKNIFGITDEALRKLVNLPLKGNVRELENIIERAIALTSSKQISLVDIPGGFSIAAVPHESPQGQLVPIYLGESIKAAEQKLIMATLEMVGNKQIEAARILGVTDRTLRNKLKEYNET